MTRHAQICLLRIMKNSNFGRRLNRVTLTTNLNRYEVTGTASIKDLKDESNMLLRLTRNVTT